MRGRDGEQAVRRTETLGVVGGAEEEEEELCEMLKGGDLVEGFVVEEEDTGGYTGLNWKTVELDESVG